jgi:hypothetical protein
MASAILYPRSTRRRRPVRQGVIAMPAITASVSDPIVAGVPADAALGLRVHSGWAALARAIQPGHDRTIADIADVV